MSSVDDALTLSERLYRALRGEPMIEGSAALLTALAHVILEAEAQTPGAGKALLSAVNATLATLRRELDNPGSIQAEVAARLSGPLQ